MMINDVLLLCDDGAAVAIERSLTEACESLQIEYVGGRAALAKRLSARPPQLIITAATLSWGRGMDVLAEVQAVPLRCPVVVYAAPADPHATAKMTADYLRAGAADLVLHTEDHADLIVAIKRALAEHGGIALEARELDEAAIVHRLTAALINKTDIDDILDEVVGTVRLLLNGISGICLLILNETGDSLRVAKLWEAGEEINFWRDGEVIPVSEAKILQKTLKQQKTLVCKDFSLEPSTPPSLNEDIAQGLRAMMCVPILLQGENLGVLQIYNYKEPRVYSREEVYLCESVCNYAAIALQNARLFAANERQLELAETLSNVGALLTTRLSLDEVYERIFDLLAQVVEYDTVSVQLFDHRYETLNLAAGRGFRDWDRTLEIVSEVGNTVLNFFDGKRRVRIIDDTLNNPFWTPLEGSEPIRSSVSCPLVIRGQIIGVLNVDSFKPNTYDEIVGNVVLSFANQAAVAIENKRLYDEVEARATKLDILNRVALAGAAAANLDELLALVTEAITESLYTYNFGFILVDEEMGVMWEHSSYFRINGKSNVEKMTLEKGILAEVARSGNVYNCRDVAQDPHYYTFDGQGGSEITVPVKMDGRIIGLINVESPEVEAFSDKDESFLSTLAGQIATVMRRVQLLEEIRQHAAHLEEQVDARTEALMAAHERTQAILESAGEGIMFTDPDATILYANEAMALQTGYEVAELVGQTPRLFRSGHVEDEEYREMWEELLSGNRWRGELINKHRDGTLHTVAIVISPLYDKHEKLTGFVSVQSDITQLKELDRLKSEFVSNVSHELRTPLTNIRTFLTLLKRGRAEKHSYYLQVLESESERLGRLIADLLDLSRLDTQSVPTTLLPLNIANFLRVIGEQYQAMAEEKDIDLEVDIPLGLGYGLADEEQLKQVFINLLGNAIAYTPKGGTIVISAAEAEGETSPMLKICVADTGMGIATADQEKIFERFYRGEAARKARTPGTGLGLAISREIILRHGGTISFKSEPGNGAEFTVCIQQAHSSTINHPWDSDSTPVAPV